MRKCLSVLLLVFLAAGFSWASEEEYLDWTSVAVRVVSTPQAGDISCSAVVAEGVWREFVIRAFGRSFVLSASDLGRLAGFPLSSLQTTHEQGYEELGGYTVHFRFQRTFYNRDTVLVTEIVYVSVNRLGLTVLGPMVR